jgi:hypothetical protein
MKRPASHWLYKHAYLSEEQNRKKSVKHKQEFAFQ